MDKEFLDKLEQEMLNIGEINLITTVLWYQYKEVLKEYEESNTSIKDADIKQLKTLPALISDKLKACIDKLDLDELQHDINTYINSLIKTETTYSKTFSGEYGDTTYLTDSLYNNLHVGDVLVSKYNYMVVVDTTDNEYVGKLVTDDPNHSCKDIPYSLGDGSDYKLYKGYDQINSKDDLIKIYQEWAANN
jgi:hypothetical protein